MTTDFNNTADAIANINTEISAERAELLAAYADAHLAALGFAPCLDDMVSTPSTWIKVMIESLRDIA